MNIRGKLAIHFFFFLAPLFTFAQKIFVDTLYCDKNRLLKNIAIDKEDFDIIIDYIDDEKREIIFSGTAKDLTSLRATQYDVLTETLDFKVRLSYIDDERVVLIPEELEYQFKVNRATDFSYMSSEVLKQIKQELEILSIYGPNFKIDSYFQKKLFEYEDEMKQKKILSENPNIKKKERKNAENEYKKLVVKHNMYDSMFSETKNLITRLKLYYIFEN